MKDQVPIIKQREEFFRHCDNVNNIYSFGFKVRWAARGTLGPTWKMDHNFSPYTRLYFINSGKGWICHNGKTIPLESGYVYVIPPNSDISNGCEYLDKLWIHLNIHDIDRLDLMMKFSEIKRFKFSKQEFNDFYAALTSDDYFKCIKVFSIILNVILAYTSLTPTSLPTKTYSPLIVKAMKYIQQNIRISLSTEEIAAELMVSPSTLRQRFKAEMGQTIGKYIDKLVFSEAQQMLMDDWISIDEVSNRLGFSNRFYFSNRFKELFDQTPAQYRKLTLSSCQKNK